jgi:hypothetical protein
VTRRNNRQWCSPGAQGLGAEGGKCGSNTVLRGQKDGALAPFIGSGGEEMAGREGGQRSVK